MTFTEDGKSNEEQENKVPDVFVQDDLKDSLKAQLDGAQALTSWVLLVAIVLLFGGVLQSAQIEVLGLKIPKELAFTIATPIFLLVNIAIFVHFVRVYALLNQVSDEKWWVVFSAVGTHKWLLNPFAFYGFSLNNRLASCFGYGALIVVWWICNGTIFVLGNNSNFKNHPVLFWFLSFFAFVGFASMASIQAVVNLILKRSSDLSNQIGMKFRSSQTERGVTALIGIALGGLIAVSLLRLTTLTSP